MLFAAVRGFLDKIQVAHVKKFVKEYLHLLETQEAEMMLAISENGVLTPAFEEKLKSILSNFTGRFNNELKRTA